MAVKNILLFVHGVGSHKKGWSQDEQDGPQKALETAAAYYKDQFPSQGENANPLSNSLKFVEIHYDDIFEKVRSTWNTLANSLVNDEFPGATPTGVANVANHLADVTEPDDWFGTYALDAVLYKAFPLVRQVIRHSVASQLANSVVQHTPSSGPKPRFSIAAHSLGTAVTHDAIQLLGSTAWMKFRGSIPEGIGDEMLSRLRTRYGDNPFSPGQFKWQSLFMIANVSRIFCDPKPDSDRSIVRPSFSTNNDRNAARYYYNFAHTMDPIPLVQPFSAMETWPRSAAEGHAEDRIDLRHFYEKNIHGFAHYIKHPYVHARILRRTVPGRFKDSHVAMADARVGSGGDFSNFGSALSDDDLRASFLDKLSPILSAARQAGNAVGRLEVALKQFGPIV
jgi:hypothetical protein